MRPAFILWTVIITASLICGCNRATTLEDLLAPGARPECVAGGFAFTEGPSSDAAGNVYFTDQPSDRILEYSAEGELTTFLQPAGRSNGTFFDREENLWTCADEKTSLWRIGPGKKITVMVSQYEGRPLNGPNDLWISPSGIIYLTDPFYKRDWWPYDSMPQEVQAVYRFDPGTGVLERVAEDLVQPNGIVGTPDGKMLYVADIGAGKTWRFVIGKDGRPGNRTLFCEMGSDGMTIDQKGNVYLTGKGVTVFDPEGRKIGHIDIPEAWTANVCFGGKDHHDLFITASHGLYRIRMKTGG
jgi:gluconolactonase